jgi:lactate racemase
MEIKLPYGKSHLMATIPDHILIDSIDPPEVAAALDPLRVVRAGLENLLGAVDLAALLSARSVAIAVNDKTRPVPHEHLLPPLMDFLADAGIPAEAITFYIAVGTHPPMWADEFDMVLPVAIQERYRVISHDSEDERLLVKLGETSRGTPVWTNAAFYHSDFKIVVGNIEPHQFMGFSGGVKSAAVGLSGIETININHALMTESASQLGKIEGNPARAEIEEIGQMVEIQLALNAVLNQDKAIVHALAGDPVAVMRAGAPLSKASSQVPVAEPFDVLLASVGGHPKDINVYQSQKGLFHAARVVKDGGTLILVAECPEGGGSPHYEDWMVGKTSHQDVLRQFEKDDFRIGIHKGYLIAKDAARLNLLFCTGMDHERARELLFNPVSDLQTAVDMALADLKPGQRVGVLTHAASTIPYVE